MPFSGASSGYGTDSRVRSLPATGNPEGRLLKKRALFSGMLHSCIMNFKAIMIVNRLGIDEAPRMGAGNIYNSSHACVRLSSSTQGQQIWIRWLAVLLEAVISDTWRQVSVQPLCPERHGHVFTSAFLSTYVVKECKAADKAAKQQRSRNKKFSGLETSTISA